jgi:biopolymer transport protein ExbD
MEISNGSATIASIPKKDEEYDLESLSELVVELKREYPEHEEASVLMESHIPYDYLIQVMDVVRSVEVPTGIEDQVELYALFSEISVGDAP